MCAGNHSGLTPGRLSGIKTRRQHTETKRRRRLGGLSSGDGRGTNAKGTRGDADIMSRDRNLTMKEIRLERKWKEEMKKRKQGQGGEKEATSSSSFEVTAAWGVQEWRELKACHEVEESPGLQQSRNQVIQVQRLVILLWIDFWLKTGLVTNYLRQ